MVEGLCELLSFGSFLKGERGNEPFCAWEHNDNDNVLQSTLGTFFSYQTKREHHQKGITLPLIASFTPLPATMATPSSGKAVAK